MNEFIEIFKYKLIGKLCLTFYISPIFATYLADTQLVKGVKIRLKMAIRRLHCYQTFKTVNQS